MPSQNTLFFGDNLEQLRDHVPSESADLIYLDPPFNSSREYNLLFKQRKGDNSAAQIMAFEDTWQWHKSAFDDFRADTRNARLFDLVESLYRILGGSEMMAYILMMAPRLLDLHRVLKATGSLYLHCDPVATHYLRLILDAVFGPQRFRNEITWKRTSAHNDAKQGRKAYGNITDTLLFYTKSDQYTFNHQYTPYSDEYVAAFYRHVDSESGRRYRLSDLTAAKGGGDTSYLWEGPDGRKVPPYKGRYWAYSQENMRRFEKEGRLAYSKEGMPSYKRYLDEMPGVSLQNLWDDIRPIQPNAKERSGYPTQKPLGLLERIVSVSSNPGDVVLDPFCGCGTAVVAAERLGRRWMGIDVTWLAIAEVVHRLSIETEAGPDSYQVEGAPKDEFTARRFFDTTKALNHKPFEMWAVSLVQGEPVEKRGADRGIDGRIPLYDRQERLRWVPIQVKGGNAGVSHVRDFAHVLDREKAPFGIFICFDKTKAMEKEAEELPPVEGFGSRRIPRLQFLTIKELLEEKRLPDIPAGYVPPRAYRGIGVEHLGQANLFHDS